MKNNREEILSRLEAIKQEKKQLKKQLKDLPSLEVGKWYKVKGYDLAMIFNTGKEKNYGLGYGGGWATRIILPSDYIYTPATDKEVETALIAEAKKRGYCENIRIEDLCNGGICTLNKAGFDMICGELWLGHCQLTNNGKWAEIIKPKTVHIPEGDYTETQVKDILNNLYEK